MTRLTDGKKTAEFAMYENNGLDFSRDFFEVGGLPYDDERNTYKVDDVDYCIEQARDWEAYRGDYDGDYEYFGTIENAPERTAEITECR